MMRFKPAEIDPSDDETRKTLKQRFNNLFFKIRDIQKNAPKFGYCENCFETIMHNPRYKYCPYCGKNIQSKNLCICNFIECYDNFYHLGGTIYGGITSGHWSSNCPKHGRCFH
jgi:RNA polymerase-binding transcription factor DksA